MGGSTPLIAREERLSTGNRLEKKTLRRESFPKRDFTPGIVAEKRRSVKYCRAERYPAAAWRGLRSGYYDTRGIALLT
jgi:hypothetical protein